MALNAREQRIALIRQHNERAAELEALPRLSNADCRFCHGIGIRVDVYPQGIRVSECDHKP